MAYGPWAGARWRTVWNNGYYRIDVQWDYCQDIENNKTKISMMAQRVASLNGYYSFTYTATQTGVGDFNGTLFAEERNVSVGGGGTTVVDCTDRHSEVPHNADGTWKNGTYYGRWRFNVPLGGAHNTPTCGWTNFTIDGEIPTIPRATTPTLSASSVACGSNITINLPRHSSSFTHRISYKIGGKDKGTITTNAGTSFAWTVPNLGSYMPNSTGVWVVLRVETMSGSTVIGYKDIGFTATAPSSWVPTASISSIAEATANLATQFGGYVQSKSTLRVKSAGSGSNGSSISSYVVTIQGRKYNGTDITSAAISASGTVPVTLTVTDSRGRTASKTQNVTVLAYSPPQITVSSVARTSDEATTATCTYNFSIASVNSKNTKAFYIQYLNGSTWTDITRMSDVYTKSGSVTSGAVFGVDATTKVRFVAQDYFTSVIVEKGVGPTFTLMNFGAGGKSLAIGRVSDNEGTYQCALAQTHAHRTSASGSNGYLKILQLVVTATAWNCGGIEFKYHCGAVGTSWFDTGKIVINGGSTTDPTPAIVMCSNPDNPIYLHKASANTWDVYVAKNGPEQAFVFDVVQFRANRIKWSFQNQQVASLPSGYIRARWEHLNACYPVGSVKLTWDAANPGTRLGGTWVQCSQGRVLLGQGTGSDGSTSMTFGAGGTGGEYNHTLTQEEMPSHYHASKPLWVGGGGAGSNNCVAGYPTTGKAGQYGIKTENTGGSKAHNNLPPYAVVFCWRRTA